MIPTLLLLPFLQEKFPSEDHPWLRFKTGTSVRSWITIKDGERIDQGIQTLTLKERDGDKYAIEEESTLSPGPKTINRTAAASKTGKGIVTVDGKALACAVWTATGERDGRPTETSYWIPEGQKNPVRVTFRQDGVEGDLKAVALSESLKVADRVYTCVKLEGTLRTPRGKGPATIWTSHEIPGAQVRMDLTLETPTGKVTFKVEAFGVKEDP
jgi:hypothetical protein